MEKVREEVRMRVENKDISPDDISRICRKWKIRRMELFGSAHTGQLHPDSDIDLLVEFEPDEQWSLMDMARAEEEFSSLFGRPVDLVDRKNLEKSANWIRREAILESTEVVYDS